MLRLLAITILALALNSVDTLMAGVILDGSGIVTDANLNVGGTVYNVQFVEGLTYNDVDTPERGFTDEVWYTGTTLSNGTVTDFFAIALKNELNTSTASLNQEEVYRFVNNEPTPTTIDNVWVYYDADGGGIDEGSISATANVWKTFNAASNPRNSGFSPPSTYTSSWAFTPSTVAEPSTVPEPSTAITMGLLGLVGFAGNRRRRHAAAV